jgi:hypothetical protein
MNMSPFVKAALAFVAALSFAIPSRADERPLLDGSGVPANGSQIDLYHVFATTLFSSLVCADFKNTAEKTAIAVYIRFEYVSVAEPTMGQIVGQDSQLVRGKFSPRVKIEMNLSQGQMESVRKLCHSVDARIADGALYFLKPPRKARLQARVLRVEYDDGSKWEAPTAPSPATRT